jgi:magnesium-transporting ATPase (P-type)
MAARHGRSVYWCVADTLLAITVVALLVVIAVVLVSIAFALTPRQGILFIIITESICMFVCGLRFSWSVVMHRYDPPGVSFSDRFANPMMDGEELRAYVTRGRARAHKAWPL